MNANVSNQARAIVGARVILSDRDSVDDDDALWAAGYALFMATKDGHEREILRGMVRAAEECDAGFDFAITRALRTAFDMTTGPAPTKSTEEAPVGAYRLVGLKTEWHTMTSPRFGGAPVKIGDRALVRGERWSDETPHVAVCSDIATDEDEPIWRSLTMIPSKDPVHDPGTLRYVDRIEDLAPGTWTRLPW